VLTTNEALKRMDKRVWNAVHWPERKHGPANFILLTRNKHINAF